MKYCRWPSKVQYEILLLITGTIILFSTLVSHGRDKQRVREGPYAVDGDALRNDFSYQTQWLFI